MVRLELIAAICLLSSLGASAAVHAENPAAVSQSKPSPLAQIRPDHVLVSTGDYAGTLRWYHDILGFEVVREWTVPSLPDVQVAYIDRNGFRIEVVSTKESFQNKKLPPNVFAALGDRGFAHLAFLVPDVDAVAVELKAKGVNLILPATSIPDADRRVLFIRDNNGNMIEFVTPLTDYDAPHIHVSAKEAADRGK